MDPFAGSYGDPQSLHKYAYAHGDPVNGVDPSGNWTSLDTLVTASVIVIIAGGLLGHLSKKGWVRGVLAGGAFAAGLGLCYANKKAIRRALFAGTVGLLAAAGIILLFDLYNVIIEVDPTGAELRRKKWEYIFAAFEGFSWPFFQAALGRSDRFNEWIGLSVAVMQWLSDAWQAEHDPTQNSADVLATGALTLVVSILLDNALTTSLFTNMSPALKRELVQKFPSAQSAAVLLGRSGRARELAGEAMLNLGRAFIKKLGEKGIKDEDIGTGPLQ